MRRLAQVILLASAIFGRPAWSGENDAALLPTRLHPSTLDAHSTESAGSTPGASGAAKCDDDALAGIKKLFSAAYQANGDTFQAAYNDYQAAWGPIAGQCAVDKKTAQLLATVQKLDPDRLAISRVNEARADLNSLRDRLRLATDETSINALSATAKQIISLATAAYGAVSAQYNWPDFTCVGDDRITPKATTSLPEAASKDPVVIATASSYCQALFAFSSFNGAATSRRGAAKSLCGGFSADGNFRSRCLVYGLVSSAISYIWKLGENPAGVNGTPLMSLLVPYGGVRFTPWAGEFGRFISLDLTLYSAFITTGTIQSPQTAPCIQNGNALERSLHCETNPTIRPFAGSGFGVTVGEDKVGYLSITPISVGVAQFGAQGIHWFYGMYASILQLTGRF